MISDFFCVVLTLPVTLIAISVMYLHSKGIAHSDLKAANILVDGNGAARVADFGVRLLFVLYIQANLSESMMPTKVHAFPPGRADRPKNLRQPRQLHQRRLKRNNRVRE